ncbi:MAG: hypothetical protein ABH863_04500, partial [Candidatus Micrarchaeota archaeon]
MKSLDALLLLGGLAVFLSQAYYALPITSDAYENFRIVKYFQDGGNFPIESAAIGAPPTIYPPVFALALYSFSELTNFPPHAALNFLSYIFMLLTAYLAYLLIRDAHSEETGGSGNGKGKPAVKTKPPFGLDEKAMLGVLGIFSLPILLYRWITPIAEMLGLVMFLLCLHAYQKRDYRFLMALLAIFPLIHSRSFVFALLTLGFAALQRKDKMQTIKSAAIGTIIFGLYHLEYPVYAIGFDNPLVIDPAIWEIVPLLPLAMMVIGALALMKNKMRPDILSTSVIAAFVLAYFILPFPFRHVIFLIIPLAYLSGEAFATDRRILAAFCVFLALAMVQTVQYRSTPIDSQGIEMMGVIGDHPSENVLSDFGLNYALPLFAGKKVVVGAFAEALPDGAARAEDLSDYLSGNWPNGRDELIRKYAIGIGFFNKKTQPDGEVAQSTRKLIESDGFVAYEYGE